MYTNFKELHKSYGFDNPLKSREHLTEEEERAFVKDCFDTYEHIGFTKTFNTIYSDAKKYNGMKFSVLNRLDETACDLEVLPMWKIQLENGDEIGAFPEEICLEEHK